MIYIGLPQWSHPKWARLGITSLEEYARHFNCVEGNTTPFLFLHTPDIAQAPELVNTLWHDLRSVLPEIGTAPSIPQQSSLF
ncbi:hypothetical protein ABXH60_000387 [Salmonella enterica]